MSNNQTTLNTSSSPPTKRGGELAEMPCSALPPILDACCGGRQFWFDKDNPDVLFADCRVMPPKEVGKGKHKRIRKCLPDQVHDFRKMEYPSESFSLVVFDPPHLFLGENAFMAQSYGRLDKFTWQDDLRKGFNECYRVLRPNGVLIFKWNECDVPLKDVLKLAPIAPLFGHPSGKAMKTHWVAFMKQNPTGQERKASSDPNRSTTN